MSDQAPIRVVNYRVLDDLHITELTEPGLHVLRAPEELEPLLSDFYRFAPQPTPPVDWLQEMIVVAALGSRPSSGYDIRVDRLTEQQGTLIAHCRETRPGDAECVLTVLTHPCTAIATPSHPGPIEHETTVTPRD
jgi:hypothetical protein